MVKTNTAKCSSCTKNLLPHKTALTCDLCFSSYNTKCAKLTRGEACSILISRHSWTCYNCISNILPVDIPVPTTRNQPVRITNNKNHMCGTCNKNVGHKSKICNWCDKICQRCI